MSELGFVEAYAKAAVRKPQMAADAALRALVFSESGDRAILAGLIAQEPRPAAGSSPSTGALRLHPQRGGRCSARFPACLMGRLRSAGRHDFSEQMLRELAIGEMPSRPQLLHGPNRELSRLVAAGSRQPHAHPGPRPPQVAEECWLAGVDTGRGIA
jgi:hypothetical protein